ncbi:MAG: mechanosensitive ion channel family protein [Bacteroidetes bacterium]|nr:mechanosensitive ion channel family protein [Bacteroidota bacterium]
METKTYIDQLIELAWNYGPKIILALIILVVGLWLIKRVTRGFEMFLKARKVDDSLRPFFVSLNDVGLKVILLLVVASMVGLETTSFIAIFSAIAFSVGLALQGSLGNFASGVLILLFRPYKVGDLITVSGLSGRVTEIQIFNTLLLTSQGKKIIIPNGKITEGPIENIADKDLVFAEITLLVNIETPLDLLRSAAEEATQLCLHRNPEREVEVKIKSINREDMRVEIGCPTIGEHYEATMDVLPEALKISFEKMGVQLAKERRRESL